MDALMSKRSDSSIIAEAKKRFKRCEEWESESRARFVEDRKFANADSENGWQWNDKVRTARELDSRPCLTINKTRQHNLQIINDARQNKPSIDVRPVSNGATYEAAEVFESITRHIEYISNAQTIYDRASVFQVEGGIGYWRVVTDYADDESLDQEIFLRAVKDPLSIYLDPDITELDGSDARFGFVFDDMPHDLAKAKFPQFADAFPTADTLGKGNEWLSKDHVRVAEYFRKSEVTDRLISYVDQDGNRQTVRASAMAQPIVDGLIADPDTRTRDLIGSKIEWFQIIGDKIVDRNTWPGIYIPIVRVVGEETVIEGQLDRKGHTRSLKDPQRQYNFWSSGAAEFVALQSKSPYVAPVRSIEGLENYWENANTENFAVLPYNDVDDVGVEIARPQRSEPPVMAPAFIAGMQVARQELMEVSGQYQAEMGAPSNEKSGLAIQERQRQGDNATYHFIDHLAVAIRFTGKILIDLIPKIYDTPRIVRILGEDGTGEPVQLDPQAKQAYQEQTNRDGQVVAKIFNPNVGRYDVQADIGPNYGTKRQEAFTALTQIVMRSENLMPIIGDIVFKAADFPMSDEVAERLARMVPAQALGGPSPEIVGLQTQNQQLEAALAASIKALADEKKKVGVETYKAETARLAIGKDIDPAALMPAIHAAIVQALQTNPITAQAA
jgi:hypothetical protein